MSASAGEVADGDAERYRRAAEEALRQIEFCIRYLRRIQKRQLASRLAENRERIRRNLTAERPGGRRTRRRAT